MGSINAWLYPQTTRFQKKWQIYMSGWSKACFWWVAPNLCQANQSIVFTLNRLSAPAIKSTGHVVWQSYVLCWEVVYDWICCILTPRCLWYIWSVTLPSWWWQLQIIWWRFDLRSPRCLHGKIKKPFYEHLSLTALKLFSVGRIDASFQPQTHHRFRL